MATTPNPTRPQTLVDPTDARTRSTPSQGLGILGDMAFRLRKGLLAGLVGIMAIEAGILYRIWSQVNGSEPANPPGAWIFSLAGSLIEPFRGYDTVKPITNQAILDRPALIAFEVYFFAGLIMALLAFALAWALPKEIRHGGWEFNLVPVFRATGNAFANARAVYAAADVIAEVAVKSAVTYFKTRDWQGYRVRGRAAWQSADVAIARRVQAIAATPEWETLRTSARTSWQRTDAVSRQVMARSQGWRAHASERARAALAAYDAAALDLARRIEAWRQQNGVQIVAALKEADRREAVFAVHLLKTGWAAVSGRWPSEQTWDSTGREGSKTERLSRRDFLRLAVGSQTDSRR